MWIRVMFLWCIATQLQAQIVTISDALTGKPLEMVLVIRQDRGLFVSTNLEGQADLSAFAPGDTLFLQRIGYESTTVTYSQLLEQALMLALTPSDLSLDQVVVSATRWDQQQRDIPSRITTIDPNDVRFQDVQTAADLLGASGEVFIQKSQLGGGSPMIRGFSTNRLLYTVDGVRMNTAIFRSGNLQNVISLDPFAIEQTEVLFGPGSIIYGSDAIGAVMSFRTLTPQFSLGKKPLIKGKAAARYATASREKTVHADLHAGWKKWALVSSITATDFDDLRMGSHGPDEYLRPFFVDRQGQDDLIVPNRDPEVQIPTGYGQINLMQKVRFAPSSDWDLQYGFHYSTTTDFPRYDRHIRLRNGMPRSAVWEYGPQQWLMHMVSAAHTRAEGWYDQLRLRLAYQRFGESRIDRDFDDPWLNERTERVDAWSSNLDLTKAWNRRTRIFYGLEWVTNLVDSRSASTHIQDGQMRPISTRYPQSDWNSGAVYFTLQQQLHPHWKLQSGIRYNHFALNSDFTDNLPFYPFPFREIKLNNAALTASLGLVHTPDDAWTLSAQISSGFRAPNVDDVGKIFDSEPGAVIVPNPDLGAEYAYNGEISINRVLGEAIKLDFTAFYTWLDQAMVRRDFQLNGQDSIVYAGELSQVQAIQNVASTTVYGIQVGMEVRLAPGWSLTSRYNWQRGEEELDDGSIGPSRHAAPAYGVTRINWRQSKWRLQLYALYQSEVDFEDLPEEERGKPYLYAVDDQGQPFAPAWMTFNVKGSYQLTDDLILQLGLENLTDRRYRPYSSGIAGAGLNLIASIRAEI